MAISWLNGVISVREDLFGETFILFEVSQSSRVCMYCCRLAAAVLYCGCCVLIVRSSAYDIRCVFGSVGRGMSCMKRLKSVGESTEPCGTPFVKRFVGDGLPLYSVYASLPERKLASHFLKFGCMFVLRIFCMSKWRGTVSKALLMSIAASSDLCAGLRWLKPSVMFCVRLVSSVLVECCGLKPCCVGDSGMCGVVLFRTNLSSIFDVLHRRDIGL